MPKPRLPNPKTAPVHTPEADALDAAIRAQTGDNYPPYELLLQWLGAGYTQEQILSNIDRYLAQAEAEGRAEAVAANVSEDRWKEWAAHLVVVKGHGHWDEVFPPKKKLSGPNPNVDPKTGEWIKFRPDPD